LFSTALKRLQVVQEQHGVSTYDLVQYRSTQFFDFIQCTNHCVSTRPALLMRMVRTMAAGGAGNRRLMAKLAPQARPATSTNVGRPAITTLMPFARISATWPYQHDAVERLRARTALGHPACCQKIVSSSGKSSVASSSMRRWINGQSAHHMGKFTDERGQTGGGLGTGVDEVGDGFHAWAESILSLRKNRSVNSRAQPARVTSPAPAVGPVSGQGGRGLRTADQQQLKHDRTTMRRNSSTSSP
jgi:hypothetical protein